MNKIKIHQSWYKTLCWALSSSTSCDTWWDTWYERTTLSLPSTRLFYLRFREILHLLIFLHFTCHTNLDPITPLHLFPLGGAVQPVFDEIEPLLFVIALVEAGRGFAPHTMLQPYWSTAMLKFQICVFRIYQTKHQPPSAHREPPRQYTQVATYMELWPITSMPALATGFEMTDM